MLLKMVATGEYCNRGLEGEREEERGGEKEGEEMCEDEGLLCC